MNILSEMMIQAPAAVEGLMAWRRSAQMCSREAQDFVYVLMGGWLFLLIFGIWRYRRINLIASRKIGTNHNMTAEGFTKPTSDSF